MDFNFTGGLYLNRNSFLEVPPNTTEICHNAFLMRDGILQKRRGFYLTYEVPEESKLSGIFKYSDRLLAVIDNELVLLESDLKDIESTYTSTYAIADDSNFAVSNNNLYIASLNNAGILKLDGLDSELKSAGVNRSLDINATLTGKLGVHPANSQANYRILFGYTDNNNNKIVSAPSNLTTVVNPNISASATVATLTVTVTSNSHGLVNGDSITVTQAFTSTNVDVVNVVGDYTVTVISTSSFQFTLLATPIGTLARIGYNTRKTANIEANLNEDVRAGWFCQIYRSSYSLSANVSALEDLQLVDEVTITQDNVDARLFLYEDEIPENLRRGFLYTNPSAEGIVNSNIPPPASRCITSHKSCMFYSNVKEKARKNVTLVTVTLLVVNDTVSITTIKNGVLATYTYTAKAVESVVNKQFRLRTNSSVSINIDTTARSLCNVINRDLTNDITAYYISGANDLAGQIILEASDYTVDSFYVNTTKPLSFSPSIPATGDGYSASINIETNKIMFSKIQEPEAVPLGNFLVLGDKNEQILNVASLKDSLIILTDKGVYRLGGDVPSEFFTKVIDTSVSCVASNSVAVLNENVLFLSHRGVVAANENSVQIVSENISAILLNTLEREGVEDARAYAYPSENAYFLSSLRENSVSPEDRITYVFSAKTGAWSTVDTNFNAHAYYNNDMIIVAQDGLSIFKERKDRQMTDFVDYAGLTFTPTSFDESNNTVRGIINRADLIKYSALRSAEDFAVIRATRQILNDEYEFTLNYLPIMFEEDGITFKTFEVDTGIETHIVTSPLFASSQSNGIEQTKYFQEAQFRFRNDIACSGLTVQFKNNNSVGRQVDLRTELIPTKLGWGFEPWGGFDWGSSSTIERNYYTTEAISLRTYVDKEISRSQYIQIDVKHSLPEPLDLQSISVLVFTTKSRKIER